MEPFLFFVCGLLVGILIATVFVGIEISKVFRNLL